MYLYGSNCNSVHLPIIMYMYRIVGDIFVGANFRFDLFQRALGCTVLGQNLGCKPIPTFAVRGQMSVQ